MRADDRGSAFARAAGLFNRIAVSVWFAYGSILLIQSKLLWGIWAHRDLTAGDTSSYFVTASRWMHSFDVTASWSPLYMVSWGSLRWLIHDPYASTIVIRVLITLAASLLVLAVLRRLFSPGIAWALAVWWAIVPVNYDVMYEVHLSVLLPLLAAVLIALTWTGLRMRAAVFAVLLATAVLLRNEAAVPLAVWTVAWISYEVRVRRQGAGVPIRTLIYAAGIPIAAVALVMTSALARSNGDVLTQARGEQTVGLCQAYAFGYQQRHDDFTGSPWLGCRPLMKRKFGRELPTLTQAIEANPGAMAEQVSWNAGLIPYSLQLMLFDRISAGQNHDPDYLPVRANSTLALVGSIAAAAFLVSGFVLLWRGRERWWRDWIRPRAWGWLALAALGTALLPVLFLQRPRPEYLFGLSVFTFAVLGLCAMAWLERLPRLKQLRAGIPIAAVLLTVLLPSHFTSAYETPLLARHGRPLGAMVARVHPVAAELRGGDVHLLATYADDGCNYIGEWDPCTAVHWTNIVPPNSTADARPALSAHHVDFIYADKTDLSQPWLRAAVAQAESGGWRRIAPAQQGQGWILLARPKSP